MTRRRAALSKILNSYRPETGSSLSTINYELSTAVQEEPMIKSILPLFALLALTLILAV
jgi:hypothetical protein